MPAARELGVAVVAYRVLADGLLTGTLTGAHANGGRHYSVPRLREENLEHNLRPVAKLKELAAAKGRTPAQLAVAWLLTRGEDIIPIVGMSRRDRIPENLQALDVAFTAVELETLKNAFAPDAIIGDRYPEMVMKLAAR